MEDRDFSIHEIYPIEEAQDTPSESSTDSNSEEFSAPYNKLASASPTVTRAMGNLGNMLSAAMSEVSPASERSLRRTYSLDSKKSYSPSSLRNLPQRNPSLDRIIDYGRATMRNSAFAPTGASAHNAGQTFQSREIDFEDSGTESDSELSESSNSSSSSSYHSGRIIGLSVPFQEEYMTGTSPFSSKSVSRSSSRPEEIVKSVKSEPVPAMSAKKNYIKPYSNNQLNNKATMQYQQQQHYYPQQQEEEVVYDAPQQKKKLFRNPFKHQQQVVEENYESYPSEEEQYYEEEQPAYHQQAQWRKQPQQQQYYPEQGQYSSTSSEEEDFGPAPLSWKRKIWNHSKPFIIKSGTTLLLSAFLPPKYVPMAKNMIFKFLGVPPSGVMPQQSIRGGRYADQQQQLGGYPQQQAYVGKRKVGKAVFRKVLLLGGGLVASGLSALLAWRFLLKPKFGKNIYSTEPKALGKLEKNEELDEQLASQGQSGRMVDRIKKSAFGIKGSPAVLEKKTRTVKKWPEPEGLYPEGTYVDSRNV